MVLGLCRIYQAKGRGRGWEGGKGFFSLLLSCNGGKLELDSVDLQTISISGNKNLENVSLPPD